MSEEGFSFELSATQAAITFLFVGLVLGGTSGMAVGATAFNGGMDVLDSGESGENTNAGSDKSSSGNGFVSLEGVEFEGEPTKGDSDAPIKIVEVNEFGCPFCAEFKGVDASSRIPLDRLDVAGQIEDRYIDEGKVQLISKDYPVPRLHPNGPAAHKAANCVFENERDSYWTFYDELFERRDQWMRSGKGDTEDTFREISQDLGLDTEAVMQCYENSDNSEAREDKRNIVNTAGNLGTPTFFVGSREKGFVKITGAQPLPRFEEAINKVQNQ